MSLEKQCASSGLRIGCYRSRGAAGVDKWPTCQGLGFGYGHKVLVGDDRNAVSVADHAAIVAKAELVLANPREVRIRPV